MDSRNLVSVILPATDETYSLIETAEQCRSGLPDYHLQFIIVTSPKFTTSACRDAIKTLQGRYPEQIETFDQRLPGLGGALQEAFDRAQGEITVLMSSDLETDPKVLPLMLKKMSAGYDVVATTRWTRRAGFSGYNKIKLLLNFFFQQFFRILYWTSLTDLTYAYRAYRTDKLKKIRWEEMQFPFLFESIVKPLRLGYRVTEVPAPWRVRPEGISHNSFKQTLDYARIGIRVRFQKKTKMLYTTHS